MRRAAASSLARRGGEKGVNGRDFESGKRQRSAYPAAARRNVCDARAEAAAASGRVTILRICSGLGQISGTVVGSARFPGTVLGSAQIPRIEIWAEPGTWAQNAVPAAGYAQVSPGVSSHCRSGAYEAAW